MFDFKSMLERGLFLKTSGSTGPAKMIFQSAKKIKSANSVAREVQKINPNSKILTVCSINHAGGLLAQTLPGLEIGASVEIKSFNAFKWADQIKTFSHTHLTPKHIELLRKTKTWGQLDLSHVRITCGSDVVTSAMIEESIDQGAIFTVNWGMTEIGPCAINKTFYPGDFIPSFVGGSIMGSDVFCDYKIVRNQLIVKGDICVYDGWFNTNDLVHYDGKNFYFLGREEVTNSI